MASDWREQSSAGTSTDAAGSQRFESGEVRSWDQVGENGTPSTSPPYWDTDDEDDDSGPRPSDLYGKFTWKIENFSQISKRELRSNVFEVGGYKWYILVYPQGCDVCNHLSLFLCVSDYDKLLPGWSHFAQFTIAVVNKDPKKSKYSDTLHRFCKKEHDWGWKKFMELSKVLDGFIVADILVIKAQVQVIRENPHRPFRCLDCQYRRELVRVYLTNVEGICRRFVEEKREKLGKLIEDSMRWSSFRAFWAAIEENVRHRLAREKTDVILKGIVKRFFNEKEVTSTLVMDALYSGCKALNYRSRNKKENINSIEGDSTSSHVVWVEKDFFVLADDVLSLVERAATERLPPFKEDKGPQNRTKDGSAGDEFGKDSVERDERHLTELGRRTIEIFVLAHLFSNRVEVAYREAIALKRQEELIREEEAAGQAEIEFRAKREAAEKEKRSKKKQAKQRRNSRKEKDQGKEKGDLLVQDKQQQENLSSSTKLKECYLEEHSVSNLASLGTADEDDDLSGLDTADNVVGTLGPAVEDGDTDQADWDRDGSETPRAMEASFSGDISLQPAQSGRVGRKHQAAPDDSSSTCSTDSIASVVVNGSYKGRPLLPDHSQTSTRGKNKTDNERHEKDSCLVEPDNFGQVTHTDLSSAPEASSSSNVAGLEAETAILSLKERVHWLEKRLVEKDEEVVLLQSKLSLRQCQMDHDKPNEQFQERTADCYFTGDSGLLRSLDADTGKQESSCIQVDGVLMDSDKPCSVISTPAKHSLANDLPSQRSNLPRCNSTANKSNIQFPHASVKQDLLKFSTYQGNSTETSHPLQTMSVSSSLALLQSNLSCSDKAPSTSKGQSLVNSANGTSIVTDISRPSSAPLIPCGPRPSVPVASIQSVPSLARSVSAAGRLGFGETMASTSTSFSQSPALTPSYKMAAAGKIQGTSGHVPHWVSTAMTPAATGPFQGFSSPQAGSFVQNRSPSSAFSPCTALDSPPSNGKMGISCVQSSSQMRGDASPTSSVAITSCMSSPHLSLLMGPEKEQSICSTIAQGECPMRLTFGTVTPELLNRQQPHEFVHNSDGFISKIDEKSCEMDHHQQRKSFLEQFMQQQPQGLQNLKVHHTPFEQDNFDIRIQQSSMQHLGIQASPTHRYSEGTDVRQASSVMSEEFPHLDIINDLLDEEHYRGKEISAMLHHPGGQHLNQQLLYPGLHRINSGHLHPEINLLNGDRVERARVYDEGVFQVHCSSDPSTIGLRESLHMVPPYSHSPYGQSYGQQCGIFEGIPPSHWPISSADFSGCSITNNGYGGLNAPVGYPMLGNHVPLGDCSSFTSGQNEYTVFSPMKEL